MSPAIALLTTLLMLLAAACDRPRGVDDAPGAPGSSASAAQAGSEAHPAGAGADSATAGTNGAETDGAEAHGAGAGARADSATAGARADSAAAQVGADGATARRVHDVHVHSNPEAAPLLLQIMDRHGIDRVVNLSGGSPGRGLEANLAIAARSGQRIVPFYNIPWSLLETEGPRFGQVVADELRLAVELGAAGLKVSKALGLSVTDADGALLAVDDPRLDPIWAAAGALGIPVSIHTGDPKAFFDPITPDNERYEELAAHPSWSFADPSFPRRDALLAARDRVIARHPGTTFICVHFANNPEEIDYVDRLLSTHPNATVDVAARLGEIGRHDAARVRQVFIKHRDRVLFGTDFMLFQRGERVGLILGSSGETPAGFEDIAPFFDAHWRFFESDEASMPNPVPIQGRWPIHPLDLPPDVLADLYLHNAERLIFTPHDQRRLARSTPGDPPPAPE